MADRELEHPPAGHEEKDINSIAITKFGIGLTITIVVSVFLVWGLFNYFVKLEERSYGGGPQLAGVGENAAKAPPQPRLQASPPIDLRDMRAAEDQLLHHYSWVDRDKGVVRIPIERAMDILATRGLPSRPAVGQPQGTTK
jgi:hypothetical protein